MQEILVPRMFGQVVRDRRIALGLTQQQLAYEACVSREFINRLEIGKAKSMYPQKLFDVFEVLGLEIFVNEKEIPKDMPLEKSGKTPFASIKDRNDKATKKLEQHLIHLGIDPNKYLNRR